MTLQKWSRIYLPNILHGSLLSEHRKDIAKGRWSKGQKRTRISWMISSASVIKCKKKKNALGIIMFLYRTWRRGGCSSQLYQKARTGFLHILYAWSQHNHYIKYTEDRHWKVNAYFNNIIAYVQIYILNMEFLVFANRQGVYKVCLKFTRMFIFGK